MGDYFKPWRRKVGVLTLLLALVLMGGWVRSLIVEDRIIFSDITGSPEKQNAFAGLATERQSLHLLVYASVSFGSQTTITMTPSDSMGVSSEVPQSEEEEKVNLDYDKPMMALAFPENQQIPILEQHGTFVSFPDLMLPVPFVVIPYWSITIPLTLLSAFLLLIKPRSTTPKKSPEPIAEGI